MKKTTCITALLILTAVAAGAQPGFKKESTPGGGSSGGSGSSSSGNRVPETFASPEAEQAALLDIYFYPPELIMQHQIAIGLTADQQSAIRNEMQQMMAQFTDLQWRESAEVESLAAIIKQDHPDEKAALTALDNLMEIENKIKHLHTQSLIRIKGLLTPEQEAQLAILKKNGSPAAKTYR